MVKQQANSRGKYKPRDVSEMTEPPKPLLVLRVFVDAGGLGSGLGAFRVSRMEVKAKGQSRSESLKAKPLDVDWDLHLRERVSQN